MSPQSLLVLAAVSWTLSMVLTPLSARLALRWGLLDRPADHKFHARPTPLLGGLALYVGILGPLLVFGHGPAGSGPWSFAGAVSLLFLVGLWDDWRHLAVGVRLVVQIAAALALLGAGLRIDLPLPEWILAGLSLLWIVGITNAVNLLDSMDGAAAGVTAIAALGFLVVTTGSPLAISLAAALLGAAVGFLPYNLHRARVFMGDAGSLVLGFSLATVGLDARTEGLEPATAWMIPVLIAAVPIFDTTLVSWSRLRQGKNPMTHPGKDHLAHRLARHGLGVRGAVLGLYAVGFLGLVLSLMVKHGVTAWAVGIVVALIALLAAVWLERPSLIGESVREETG